MTTYAVLEHPRWSDDEEPQATVMYTNSEWRWHAMCTCWTEDAYEIAEALQLVADQREARRQEEVERLREELEAENVRDDS